MNETTDVSARYVRDGFRWVDLLIVISLGLLIHCHRLGEGPLAGTEGNRALVAHQMVQSGRWLLPYLFDQPYLTKPPLDYWILASAEKLTGRADPFIWRLPSAVAGALLAGFLYFIGARWYGRLAGIVSGCSCLAMVALWGQNHTAEIDALNTLAVVMAACLLIDLASGPERDRLWITLCAGLSLAAALLLKGPAGSTSIIAAIVGPVIINRNAEALKKPWMWIAVVVGLVPSVAYAVAAARESVALHLPLETSGISELRVNLFGHDRVKNLPATILLPLTAMMYMLPISLCLPLAVRASVWKPKTSLSSSRWSESDRLLLRGLVGTMGAACFLTMLCGLVDPRYSYVWLPIVCPVAGATVAAWHRRIFAPQRDDYVNVSLACSAIAIAAAIPVIAVLSLLLRHREYTWLYVACAVAGAICAALCYWSIKRFRMDRAGIALMGVLVALSFAYGAEIVVDRQVRSRTAVADVLRANLKPGERVTTGHLVLDSPEIYYYGKVNVESYPHSFDKPMIFPTSRWILFTGEEYQSWSKSVPGRLSRVQHVYCKKMEAVLAWYDSDVPRTAQDGMNAPVPQAMNDVVSGGQGAEIIESTPESAKLH